MAKRHRNRPVVETPALVSHRVTGIQKPGEAMAHQSAEGLSERPARSQKAITKREETADDLRTREKILQEIVNNLPLMIGVADASGHVTMVNRQWERTLGWSLEELQKQNLDIFTAAFPNPRNRQRALDFVAAATGEWRDFSLRVRDGRTIHTTWARFILADGTSFAIGQDITERKQSADLLREAHRRTESVLANVSDAHVLFDRQWRYVYVNDAATQAIGRPREQIIGRTLWELYPDIVGTELDRQYRRAMEERLPVALEFHYLKPDSWWENRFSPLPGGLAVFATNITERKRAESEHARLAAIVRSSDDAIIGITLGGIIVSWNEGAARMYGYTAEEIVGCSISRLIPPDQPDELSGILLRLARGENIDHYETARVRKDGRRIDVSLTISPLRDAAGSVWGASTVARNMTERNQAQQATRRSEQQLRALSAHLQTVREEERTRIAREIHDELGQVLTGLRMELSLLEESWTRVTPRDLRAPYESAFRRLESLVDGSIQTVRTIATELRPMMLDTLGLADAIEWQTDEFVRTSGIPCEVSLPDEDMALDRETSTALFRVLQESLTNIVRHAKASKVSVHLWNDDQTTVLQVQDNGIGIPAHSIAGATSFGLLSMKERALMLAGSLDVTSSPGAGTTITARVPHAAPEDKPIHA